MKSFSISLSQTKEKNSRFKRLLLILAILFVVISLAAYFLFYKGTNTSIWIFIGWGIYLLVNLFFGFVGYNKEMFVNADEFALEYQFGFFSKVPNKIIWETVTKVKLGFTYIAFYKKAGRRKVMELGWLPYSKLKEIKNNVHSLCKEKGINVEVAEYHTEEEFEKSK